MTEPKEDSLVEESPELEASSGEEPKQPCVGPGECLCAVREELGFNRAKVGQQLGLTETAVKDLEKNRFERFPNSVYVRGYLKNYAKILGQSELEVIEVYDRFCKENNLDSGKSTLDPLPEKKGFSPLAKASIVVITLCVIAAIIVFFGELV